MDKGLGLRGAAALAVVILVAPALGSPVQAAPWSPEPWNGSPLDGVLAESPAAMPEQASVVGPLPGPSAPAFGEGGRFVVEPTEEAVTDTGLAVASGSRAAETAAVEEMAVPADVPPLPAWTRGGPLDALTGPLPSALYVACGDVPGRDATCSPPVALGLPVSLDFDGTAGQDATVLLAPLAVPSAQDPTAQGPTALPGAGLAVTLRIALLPVGIPCTAAAWVEPQPHVDAACYFQTSRPGITTGVPDIPGRVWVDYRPFAESDQVRVGVNGTSSRLPTTTTSVVRIEDLQALQDGRAILTTNTTFEDPGASGGLFAAFAKPTPQGLVDPTTVSLHLDPWVLGLGVGIDAHLDASEVNAVLAPSQRTNATFDLTSVTRTSALALALQVQPLPLSSRVEYERLGAGLRLNYSAETGVPLVKGNFSLLRPGERVAGTLTLRELPLSFQATILPAGKRGTFDYTASSTVPSVQATFEFLQDAVLSEGHLQVTGLPPRLDVRFDFEAQRKGVRYNASEPLGATEFFLRRAGPTGLRVLVAVDPSAPRQAASPPYVDFAFEDNFTAFDARSAWDAPPGSAALGKLRASVTTAGAAFGVPFGEGDVFRLAPAQDVDGNLFDEGLRVFLRHQGLRYAEADLRTAGKTLLDVRNEAQRRLDYDVATRSLGAEGTIDAVPEQVVLTLRADSQRGDLSYRAHDPIVEAVTTFWADTASGRVRGTASVQDLPAGLLLGAWEMTPETRPDGASTDRASFEFEAPRELGPLAFDVQRGSAEQDLHLAVRASRIAPYVAFTVKEDYVEFDARAAKDAAPGSAAMGLVEAVVTPRGKDFTGTPATAHPGDDFLRVGPVVQGGSARFDATRVQLRVDGLRYALANLRDVEVLVPIPNLHLDLRLAAPRSVAYEVTAGTMLVGMDAATGARVDLPQVDLSAKGRIADLPSEVLLTVHDLELKFDRSNHTVGQVAYDAADPVAAADGSFYLRGKNGAELAGVASLRGLPSGRTVALWEFQNATDAQDRYTESKSITFDAAGELGSVDFQACLGGQRVDPCQDLRVHARVEGVGPGVLSVGVVPEKFKWEGPPGRSLDRVYVKLEQPGGIGGTPLSFLEADLRDLPPSGFVKYDDLDIHAKGIGGTFKGTFDMHGRVAATDRPGSDLRAHVRLDQWGNLAAVFVRFTGIEELRLCKLLDGCHERQVLAKTIGGLSLDLEIEQEDVKTLARERILWQAGVLSPEPTLKFSPLLTAKAHDLPASLRIEVQKWRDQFVSCNINATVLPRPCGDGRTERVQAHQLEAMELRYLSGGGGSIERLFFRDDADVPVPKTLSDVLFGPVARVIEASASRLGEELRFHLVRISDSLCDEDLGDDDYGSYIVARISTKGAFSLPRFHLQGSTALRFEDVVIAEDAALNALICLSTNDDDPNGLVLFYTEKGKLTFRAESGPVGSPLAVIVACEKDGQAWSGQFEFIIDESGAWSALAVGLGWLAIGAAAFILTAMTAGVALLLGGGILAATTGMVVSELPEPEASTLTGAIGAHIDNWKVDDLEGCGL